MIPFHLPIGADGDFSDDERVPEGGEYNGRSRYVANWGFAPEVRVWAG